MSLATKRSLNVKRLDISAHTQPGYRGSPALWGRWVGDSNPRRPAWKVYRSERCGSL